MTVSAACGGLLARDPWVSKRALTVDEYHRMGEAGILTERDRVELIEGELVAMTPIGGPHAGTVVDLTHALAEAVGPGARLRTEPHPARRDQRAGAGCGAAETPSGPLQDRDTSSGGRPPRGRGRRCQLGV